MDIIATISGVTGLLWLSLTNNAWQGWLLTFISSISWLIHGYLVHEYMMCISSIAYILVNAAGCIKRWLVD